MDFYEEKLVQRITAAVRQQHLAEEPFEFFWETKSPFSQWHRCTFTTNPIFLHPDLGEPLTFTSAEQFMMLHKAMAFGDLATAKKIMATRNVREQKALGRQVEGFIPSRWDEIKVYCVYRGNESKFMQNENLLHALKETAGKTLVEAAPDDIVWGIGLTKDDPRALQRDTWPGNNLLGLVLTALRVELTGKY